MIDDLLNIARAQLKEVNTFLNKLNVNCIMLDSGEIVADWNRGEITSGAEDINGIGGYIRYAGKIEYAPVSSRSTNNKKTSSCSDQIGVDVPLKFVVYNFDEGKEFNMIRLEEKLTNDLLNINFSAAISYETQLSLELITSDINSHDVWKSEIGSIKTGNSYFQMLSIDFKIKFVRSKMKADCFEDCDIFNNEEKC